MNQYLYPDSFNASSRFNIETKLSILQQWGDNFKEVVVAYYINYLLYNGFIIEKKEQPTFANRTLAAFDLWKKGILKAQNVLKSESHFQSQLMKFYLDEKTYFKKNKVKKHELYLELLNQHTTVFQQIDAWINNKHTRARKLWSESVNNKQLLKEIEVEQTDNYLLNFLDKVYLQCGLDLIKNLEWPTQNALIFDAFQEYIIETSVLNPEISDKKLLNKVQASLLRYIKKELIYIQNSCLLSNSVVIFSEINSWCADEITSNKIEIQSNFKLELPKDNKYPNRIFSDEKAFYLFNFFAEKFNSHVALSFFYRKMAEQEKPTLISVKDTPFREWFNDQKYDFKLDRATNTFIKSKNEERELLYWLVKSLIYSN
jgi:hypothetical protein